MRRACETAPHLRAFAVIAAVAGRGRIPLRRTSAASIPKKINSRLFIEKPREFIGIYRYFQELLFALRILSAPSGRPLGERSPRRLKNRRPTGGLSSIPHHPENPVPANAGNCARRSQAMFHLRGREWGAARPRDEEIARRADLSGYFRSLRIRIPQMRANAVSNATGGGGNAPLRRRC